MAILARDARSFGSRTTPRAWEQHASSGHPALRHRIATEGDPYTRRPRQRVAAVL